MKKLVEIICPCCDGKGKIERNVYDDDGKVVTIIIVTCQRCKGQQTIWVDIEVGDD